MEYLKTFPYRKDEPETEIDSATTAREWIEMARKEPRSMEIDLDMDAILTGAWIRKWQSENE